MCENGGYYNKKMFLMQKDSGISRISAKYSFEAMIVKHVLNLVDFQVRHYQSATVSLQVQFTWCTKHAHQLYHNFIIERILQSSYKPVND